MFEVKSIKEGATRDIAFCLVLNPNASINEIVDNTGYSNRTVTRSLSWLENHKLAYGVKPYGERSYRYSPLFPMPEQANSIERICDIADASGDTHEIELACLQAVSVVCPKKEQAPNANSVQLKDIRRWLLLSNNSAREFLEQIKNRGKGSVSVPVRYINKVFKSKAQEQANFEIEMSKIEASKNAEIKKIERPKYTRKPGQRKRGATKQDATVEVASDVQPDSLTEYMQNRQRQVMSQAV